MSASHARIALDSLDWMSEPSCKELLASLGIPVPAGGVVDSPREAAALAATLESPYVVKLVKAGVIHKSDVGGVELNLESPADVERAASRILRRTAGLGGGGQLLVEESMSGGVELTIGARSTHGFGPIVMVGLGGVWVEQLKDVAFGFAPVNESEAMRLLQRLRAWPLLSGARGAAALDTQAAAAAIATISSLAVDLNDRRFELEVNPLLVSRAGIIALDALLGTMAKDTETLSSNPAATDLERLVRPMSMAVFGADPSLPTNGNRLLREATRLGHKNVLAIHRDASALGTLEGVPAIANVAEAGKLDLLCITGPHEAALGLIENAPQGAFVNLLSSPFGVDEKERKVWTDSILTAAKAVGCRLLGPNALGVHSPGGRLSFVSGASPGRDGRVGVVLQSGGLAAELVTIGEERGVSFRTVVSVGDAVDVGVDEVLRYFLADPGTDVIGLYVESARFARGILDAVRDSSKPVAMLVGGLTPSGAAAAASHTGALAEDGRLWSSLMSDIGAVPVESLEDLATALAFLQTFGRSADYARPQALMIGTGGDGVIGADNLNLGGVATPRLEPDTADALAALDLPGVGLANPVDIAKPVALLDYLSGGGRSDHTLDQIVATVLGRQHFTDVVIQLGLNAVFHYFVEPEALLHRMLDSLVRLPDAHPSTRFTVIVAASRQNAEHAVFARKRLMGAGIAPAESIREAVLGIKAVARGAISLPH